MSEIRIVTAEDLRNMKRCEGIILQGCGGELQEWVDGINEMLTKEGIFLPQAWQMCKQSMLLFRGKTQAQFPDIELA